MIELHCINGKVINISKAHCTITLSGGAEIEYTDEDVSGVEVGGIYSFEVTPKNFLVDYRRIK